MATRSAVIAPLTLLLAMAVANAAAAARFTVGGLVGYRAGLGAEVNATAADFAEGFPLAARFAVGYARREPGNPADARRIFINDATDGTPEEAGWYWDCRFDMMYRFGWRSAENLFATAGVRYSLFTANFEFVGGNEDFDITSHQWGLGAGLEGYFDISDRVQFVIGGGVDYFFDAELTGHDTTYSPDGDHVNPRDDYTYDDARDAVNALGLEGRAVIGISYRFGG